MRILYITQKFYPESMAVERLTRQAIELAELGHVVTVLTTMPNYPRGEVLPAYKHRWFVRESIQGCRVLRVRTVATSN
ncbi:MAG TPA: glycosyltransferase WbuB, partial [Polyangiaceae bacterium]